jgi:myo-inositol-1(or 4)-monophosphatase
MNNSIETLSNEVCRIAIDTGKYLKEEQAKLTLEDIEFKGPRNYVTYIDKEAERQLVGALENLLPEAGFLTEEATIEYEQKENTWIIDPLDGTTNYIHGDNPFAVSIALMRKGKIVLGIVYDPVANELYSAIGPGKAYLNGHPIHASSHAQLQNGYIGFGIPYNLTAEGEKILANALAQFRKCSFRIKGSAAVEICYVACGRSDAYFHSGLSPWDVAAGTFILECAGGKCTDFSGGKNYLFGKELVAGNGKINQEIRNNIIQHA